MSKLFEPTNVGDIDVSNRVFMAPLTRNRAQSNGVPYDKAAKYYAQRASGGLIITEATQVNKMGKGYLDTPGIHTADQAAEWKGITDAVHAEDGKIVLQLWHVGRISHTSLLPEGRQPLAPSAIRAKAQTFAAEGMVDVSEPVEMTVDQIAETVQDYKRAALHAKEAGFDGVEIHAANGYLINQFLDDSTNLRDDAYGGSIENRMRFLKEVTEAVLEVFPAGKIGVRLSPTGSFNDMGDSDPKAHFGAVVEMLNGFGLAYLHMVERFPGIGSSEEEQDTLKSIRAKWGGFYIANGDYSRDEAIESVESGYAGAIAFGRDYIANPDLYERLKQDAELNDPIQETFYGGDETGYTDYPFLPEVKKAA